MGEALLALVSPYLGWPELGRLASCCRTLRAHIRRLVTRRLVVLASEQGSDAGSHAAALVAAAAYGQAG